MREFLLTEMIARIVKVQLRARVRNASATSADMHKWHVVSYVELRRVRIVLCVCIYILLLCALCLTACCLRRQLLQSRVRLVAAERQLLDDGHEDISVAEGASLGARFRFFVLRAFISCLCPVCPSSIRICS